MNTALSRLNSIFAYNLTTLAVLAVLVFLSTNFKDKSLETSVSVPTPKVRLDIEHMADGHSQKDYGIVKFDIEALTELFDWNTKELFVMLTVYYQTEKTEINEIVLWDKIIQRGDPAKISLQQAKPKYRFFDDGKGGLLGHENVTLQMSWNVIPHVGRLPLVYSNTYQISFPKQYTNHGTR